MTEKLTDPDSSHYERANELGRFRQVQDELRHDELEGWMYWLADALEEEIKYAADNRNERLSKLT